MFCKKHIHDQIDIKKTEFFKIFKKYSISKFTMSLKASYLYIFLQAKIQDSIDGGKT